MCYTLLTPEMDHMLITAGLVYRTLYTINHVDYVLYWGNAEIAQNFIRLCHRDNYRASFQWFDQEKGWLEA